MLQEEHELQLQRCAGSYRRRSPSTAPNRCSTPSSGEPELDPMFLTVPFQLGIFYDCVTPSAVRRLSPVWGGRGRTPRHHNSLPNSAGPGGRGRTCPGCSRGGPAVIPTPFYPCPFSICHTALRAPSQARAARRGLSRRGGVEGGWAEERCLWGGASPPCPRWLRGRRGGAVRALPAGPPRTGQRLHLAAFGARTEGSPGPQPPPPAPRTSPRGRAARGPPGHGSNAPLPRSLTKLSPQAASGHST